MLRVCHINSFKEYIIGIAKQYYSVTDDVSLSAKPNVLQRFRNESSRTRSAAEQVSDQAGARTVCDLCYDCISSTEHILQRGWWDACRDFAERGEHIENWCMMTADGPHDRSLLNDCWQKIANILWLLHVYTFNVHTWRWRHWYWRTVQMYYYGYDLNRLILFDSCSPSVLTLWRPLLPYGYSYGYRSILCQAGLSRHL